MASIFAACEALPINISEASSAHFVAHTAAFSLAPDRRIREEGRQKSTRLIHRRHSQGATEGTQLFSSHFLGTPPSWVLTALFCSIFVRQLSTMATKAAAKEIIDEIRRDMTLDGTIDEKKAKLIRALENSLEMYVPIAQDSVQSWI